MVRTDASLFKFVQELDKKRPSGTRSEKLGKKELYSGVGWE